MTKKTAYLDAGSAVCETVLSEVGTYTLTLRMKDGSERTYNVFSALPEEERDPASTAQSFSLLGTAGRNVRSSLDFSNCTGVTDGGRLGGVLL